MIVAGGSLAALAAAFTAAADGAQTVLLEPTDWIGGQLTASGVPAVDEAWHQLKADGSEPLNVASIARDPQNMTPWFRDVLHAIGNPGRGWVSRYCFEPKMILNDHLIPRERSLEDRLTIYRETVVKRMEVSGAQILSLTAIQRLPRTGLAAAGYDRLPSSDVQDWYAETDSDRFEKRTLKFTAPQGKTAIFIEATEWGELLALSGARYLQGTDQVDGSTEGNDQCGQATVFGFVQELREERADDPASQAKAPALGWGKYEGRKDAWERIWTYRRVRGGGSGPTIGDLSLQNWGYSLPAANGGNDYPFGYLFLSQADTARQCLDWQGGVNFDVLAAAEQRALAWHHWLKERTPEPFQPEQVILRPDVLGTAHGLSKLPYIRDTRRSIGIGGFVLKLADLVGKAPSQTGTIFSDRIAIGCYPADVHHLAVCEYPEHMNEHRDTRPFCIPYRALTHESFDNLLVAGKTIGAELHGQLGDTTAPHRMVNRHRCGCDCRMDLSGTGIDTQLERPHR